MSVCVRVLCARGSKCATLSAAPAKDTMAYPGGSKTCVTLLRVLASEDDNEDKKIYTYITKTLVMTTTDHPVLYLPFTLPMATT